MNRSEPLSSLASADMKVGVDETPPASPCVKVCRMDGDFCCGCRRTLGEIAEWNRMSEAERHRVLQRIERRQAAFTRNAATS